MYFRSFTITSAFTLVALLVLPGVAFIESTAADTPSVTIGACTGSCTPDACPAGTVTQQDSCGCKGGATSCKCKGTNKCYNAKGRLIATVSCSGSCQWDPNAVFIPDEVLELFIQTEGEPLVSAAGHGY